MTQETYIKITEKIRATRYGEKIVVFINKLLTEIVYIAFFALLVNLALHRDKDIIRIVLVTGISFVLVSVSRHFIDAERPYIKYNFAPLVQKEKKGESMPSRHVFSAFVIGVAFLYMNVALGIIMLIIGTLMAVTRVVVGVHFPRDVIAGAVIGILSGTIGFYLI